MDNEQFEGTIGSHEVSVSKDGVISIFPKCSSGVTLDETRLAAADHFLVHGGLTMKQRRYWTDFKSHPSRLAETYK